MKDHDRVWVVPAFYASIALVLLLMFGCTPFIQSNNEATTIGATINHKKAVDFVFNIFAHKEEASTFSKDQ